MASSADSNDLSVAIVGLGIAGATVALGLLSRGISVKLYERASGCQEIGAGIGMSPNAERAMLQLDPRIHAVFWQVATPNTEDWFQYVDGSKDSGSGDGGELLFKVYLGKRGFEGCRRADLLDELAKLLPKGCLEFNKELIEILDESVGVDGKKTQLRFRDGSSAEADIVLGCDGLRSQVRRHVLGVENPTSSPGYTHKFAFRGMVPIHKAKGSLSEDKCSTRYMHLGKNGHVLTFPVAMGTLLNVVAFVTDSEEWSNGEKLTAPARKAEAARCFAGFGPVVTTIIDLFDENLDKWAIFDTFDHPALTFVSKSGTTCLIGDSAHAAAPHHGAGAGFAIEDALAISTALHEAKIVLESSNGIDRRFVLRNALSTYEEVRLERTRWLMGSSRFIGELYEWQVPEFGQDPKLCLPVEKRCRTIWDYDISEMVRNSKTLFKAKIEGLSS